jgi:hypothetical protein
LRHFVFVERTKSEEAIYGPKHEANDRAKA